MSWTLWRAFPLVKPSLNTSAGVICFCESMRPQHQVTTASDKGSREREDRLLIRRMLSRETENSMLVWRNIRFCFAVLVNHFAQPQLADLSAYVSNGIPFREFMRLFLIFRLTIKDFPSIFKSQNVVYHLIIYIILSDRLFN